MSVGLPITQLELSTMAFVACALIMYMLWWDKPYGVERRTTITIITYDGSVIEREGTGHDRVPDLTLKGFRSIAAGQLVHLEQFVEFGKAIRQAFTNVFTRKSGTGEIPRTITTSLTFYATGTLFSGFHIASWNWEFPSSNVQALWRRFALATTIASPFAFLIIIFMSVLDYLDARIPYWVAECVLIFWVLVLSGCVVSHLGLIVLTTIY